MERLGKSIACQRSVDVVETMGRPQALCRNSHPLWSSACEREDKMTRKIGLLFSLSGTISIVGEGQLQAALLAIEQVNKTADFTFEPVIRDAKSDPHVAAREAYSLFKEAKIDALVGCYMSSVRNSVIPVLNETNGLLLYPTLYEGGEVHPNIFYLGAIPNQQVEPLLSWAIEHISNNFVLVGSDYVYPHLTNTQVRRWVENAGGCIRNETYFPLGSTDFRNFFQEFGKLSQLHSPLVVFSTIVGTSTVSFYKEYRRRNIRYPIISPITSEREIHLMGKAASAGHICGSPYFRTIASDMNQKFVNAFERRFGNQPVSREMAATYDAVHLLCEGYRRLPKPLSGKNQSQKVRMTLKNLSSQGIQGKIIIDPDSQHLWQWSRIGRVNAEGDLETIWESPGLVPPKVDTSKNTLTVRGLQGSQRASVHASLVGANKGFLECTHLAEIAGKASCNALITGETGTGKELLARYIHEVSPRRDCPFIPVNCTAIPRELMESELFGYEEGAFTGARKGGKPGKFEMANGGTFFLDEIGDMPADLQAHLLRVIEENEIYRIGGTKAVHLDVLLIAATNKNLPQEIRKGTFRKDLYYRLSGFHIALPNLCDRIDDIPLLADHFLGRLCRDNGIEKTLAAETLEVLEKHTWPGNIRELSNVIERAFYLSQDSKVIRPCDMPGYITNSEPPIDKRNGTPTVTDDADSLAPRRIEGIASVKETEKRLIRQTIACSGHNMSRAAASLGISRTTLYRKIREYQVETAVYGKTRSKVAVVDGK